jgi:hypothetical protein
MSTDNTQKQENDSQEDEFKKYVKHPDEIGSFPTFQNKRDTFFTMEHEYISRYGLLCRIFISENPKAELVKAVEELSDLINVPDFGTGERFREEEFNEWFYRVRKKYLETLHRERLDISAFLASLHPSMKNQMS